MSKIDVEVVSTSERKNQSDSYKINRYGNPFKTTLPLSVRIKWFHGISFYSPPLLYRRWLPFVKNSYFLGNDFQHQRFVLSFHKFALILHHSPVIFSFFRIEINDQAMSRSCVHISFNVVKPSASS